MRQLAPHPALPRRLNLPAGALATLDAARPAGIDPLGTALLVPGYTGGKEDFAPILGLLADCGFRVVAIDLPGQHESPGPVEPAAYAVDRLGETVLAAIDALGDGPVHLLGHSFGGFVVRAAAIVAPDRLRSLSLLDSGPAGIGGPRRARMDALEPLLDSGGMLAVYQATEELAKADPQWAAMPEVLRAFLRRRFLASSEAGLRGMGDALRYEPDRVVQLRASGVPTLVACGADDDAWSAETQREMAVRLDAAYVVIDNAMHSPALEQPDRTAQVLSDFWREVETAQRAAS